MKEVTGRENTGWVMEDNRDNAALLSLLHLPPPPGPQSRLSPPFFSLLLALLLCLLQTPLSVPPPSPCDGGMT